MLLRNCCVCFTQEVWAGSFETFPATYPENCTNLSADLVEAVSLVICEEITWRPFFFLVVGSWSSIQDRVLVGRQQLQRAFVKTGAQRGALLIENLLSTMSTRGRRKQTGTSQVPIDQYSDQPPNVAARKSVAAEQTRAKAKVSATRRTKVIVTPVEKRAPLEKKSTRVPKVGTAVSLVEESDSSQLLEDPELSVIESKSEDESQLKIEQLRKQLAELEAKQKSRRQLKLKQSQFKFDSGSHREPNSLNKRADPTEGWSLGTFNGRTDLDTFLVRFEKCSRHFSWSEPKKVFHSMNALTDSAEPIVKEVGPAGTLEHILELLQSRFGNKLRIEKFHADLQNRRRGRSESLQDPYLDLCRLRALASGEDSDEKFPEKYFRNIFVDALNDREFRRAVLVQNPGTMEEAYRVATQLEAIDA